MLKASLPKSSCFGVAPISRPTCRPVPCKAAVSTEGATLAAAKQKKLGDSELLVSREYRRLSIVLHPPLLRSLDHCVRDHSW